MCKRIIIALSVVLLSVPCWALSLSESINYAINNNPSVVSSQKQLSAAQARFSQAVGSFLPAVNLNGDYGRSYSQPSTVQITVPTTQGAVTQTYTFGTDAPTNSRGVSATLSQPVFVAALFPGYKIAQRSVDSAKEGLRKTIVDTTFQTTQAYYQVLAAAKYVDLNKESKDMSESHLKQVRLMLDAGVVTKADLLRSEVQDANAEVALTKAKNLLNLANDAFNNVLGRDLEEVVSVSDLPIGETGFVVPAYNELLATAYDNRPDWKQFLLTRQISEDNLHVAQTALLPTVMLSGTAGNRVSDYPTFRSDVNSWSVSGAASWKIFDGTVNYNKIREASSNLDAQKANEIQVRNSVALEVRNAYFNLNSTLTAVVSAKKAVESAQEGYKVSTLQYASGVKTNLEVLDAQVALTQAQTNYLQARFDIEIAKAKINQVVGKEVFKNEKG
jgi:outer membrane protein TolC